MAASKSTREQPKPRRSSKGVPQSGGRATARKSVAGGKSSGGTPAKERKAHQSALPRVQPTVEVVGPGRGDRYPLVPAEALLSAFARAEKHSAAHPVEWDASKQQWVVPSATDPRRHYRVWRRRTRTGSLPFYVHLECNCQAEQSGSYLVCWHKCAVKLWLNEWFSKRNFQEQLEDNEGQEWGGPDDVDE
jgi:hypothetical protein